VANPIKQGIAAAGTYYFAFDYFANPFNVAWEVDVPAGVTVSYELDYTVDAINPTIGVGYGVSVAASPEWIAFSTTPAGTTTQQQGDQTSPIQAMRLVVASISGGSIAFKALQPFNQG